MCIAIFKRPDAEISYDILKSCWIHNPDGAGFAYVDKKEVKVSKGYMTLKEFTGAYVKTVSRFKNSPFLLHFRIRTMGDRSRENTHPFSYKHGAMIHNGTISGTGSVYQSGKSDTALMIEKLGESLDFSLIEKNKKQFEDAFGYNKFVFLFGDGSHQIINEHSGVWDNGCWFSNRAYKSNVSPISRG